MAKIRDVLVIDASPVVRAGLRHGLTNLGMDVRCESSGLTAAVTIRSGQFPDLIILDTDMPALTGEQVAERLRDWGFEGRLLFYSARDEAFLGRVASEHKACWMSRERSLPELVERVRQCPGGCQDPSCPCA